MLEMPFILSALALLGVVAILVLQLRPKEAVRPDPRVDAISGQLQQLAAQQDRDPGGHGPAADRIGESRSGPAAGLRRRGREIPGGVEGAAGGDRRRPEKHRRAFDPDGSGCRTSSPTSSRGGAFRRGAIGRPGARRDPSRQFRVPGDACPAASGSLSAETAQSAGLDRDRRQVPLEAYRALREAKDDIATKLAQREFTTAIRTHVKAIAEKYIVAGVTAESALMFLPSEAVYAELHPTFRIWSREAGPRAGLDRLADDHDGDADDHPRGAARRQHARAGACDPGEGTGSCWAMSAGWTSGWRSCSAFRPGGGRRAPGYAFSTTRSRAAPSRSRRSSSRTTK